eukprot:CAMPEP_0181511828 /NCGR_PEP_ID=MMETSP1110-20121109/61644_1 /TAXON_ID=174948 /ORGANISM="Symbiodinium sp., Strain CCMP421" /LENGTH=130 /DNA_ID=CAMNT_0023641595 /DNA_START=11 /DNA_END=403 /DNA_ORIENTATION=-
MQAGKRQQQSDHQHLPSGQCIFVLVTQDLVELDCGPQEPQHNATEVAQEEPVVSMLPEDLHGLHIEVQVQVVAKPHGHEDIEDEVGPAAKPPGKQYDTLAAASLPVQPFQLQQLLLFCPGSEVRHTEGSV